MTKQKGKLIAFEGLDGSGKSTQASILARKISEQNIRCFLTREPSDGEIGKLIRETLTHTRQFDKMVLSSLFVADRLDHILNKGNGFIHRINAGETVICDRYYFSNYAYDANNVSLEWLINANSISASIAKPDLSIFIDTDPDVCMNRINANRNKTELYENVETLIRVRENFHKAFHLLADKEKILIVNGNQDVNEVSAEIWEKVSKLFLFKHMA